MHVSTKLSVFDTDAQLYAQLARVLAEQKNGGTKWLNLTTSDDVEITFFACDEKSEEVTAE